MPQTLNCQEFIPIANGAPAATDEYVDVGTWLVYESDESGQDEIYVRPFPEVNGGRWQISSGGGFKPVWARSGRELFYVDRSRSLVSVAVQTSPAFNAGKPTVLFPDNHNVYVSTGPRAFDVAALTVSDF